MNIRAVIWDLDGTLLDTLGDLAASTNAALQKNGLPQRSIDEVRRFVGNGIARLIERAVPEGYPPEKTRHVLDDFVAHYAQHSRDTTRPYDGVLPMLDALIAQGVRLGIVSNKIDFAVRELSTAYFGDRMQVAVGDDPSRRRKPAPDSLLYLMKKHDLNPARCVMIGDRPLDVDAAANAGMLGCLLDAEHRFDKHPCPLHVDSADKLTETLRPMPL